MEVEVFVVGRIDRLDAGGVGMIPSDIRVVATPEAAAKILCTQPRRGLAYNDDQTEEQIATLLREGIASAMTQWRYAEDRTKRTSVVLEAVPKELEGGDAEFARALLREAENSALNGEFSAAKAAVLGGYIIRTIHSSYFGSHPEYGEADGWAVIAIPKGVEITESFAHGHYGRRDGWDQAFQNECLEWDGEEWVEIDLSSSPNLYEEKPVV